MADVGGEAGVAFDAGLERTRHVVERRHQGLEVGVVDLHDPGVEPATGDGDGGGAHVGQRAQHAAADAEAQGGSGQGGHQGSRQQRDAEGPEGSLQVLERGDLEVGRLDRRKGHAHPELGVAVEGEAHAGRAAAVDHLAQALGEVFLADTDLGREPSPVPQQQGRSPARRSQRVEDVSDLDAR